MALGAERKRIVWMVLQEVIVLRALGFAIGLAVPKKPRAFRSDGASDSPVDRSTTARSLSLGCRTAISAARSGSDFRCGLGRPGEGHGIQQVLSVPRSPWRRGDIERMIGAIRREPGSHNRIHRALFVPTPSKLRQRLSSKPNALGFGERQSGAPTDPTASCGTDHRDSGGGWARSSLRPARRLNCSPAKAFLAVSYINSGPPVSVPTHHLSNQPGRARFCPPGSAMSIKDPRSLASASPDIRAKSALT
jgi:hypothetical protein